ncbi:MAG TPA: hypothetical protein VFK76_10125 [Gaiellaceae bacterium]|nr:hypothetical protein [Gaiellaceae bacterium]
MYLALELRAEIETALDAATEADRAELRVAVRLDAWQREGGAAYSDGPVKTVLDALQRSYAAELDESLARGSTDELRERVRDRVG